MMSEQATPASDGRSERSRTSRAKILEATLALIIQNGGQPSAKEVAERANVGLRSGFRHFSDMESLMVDLNSLSWQQARTKFDIPPEALAADFQTRVEDLVSLRRQLFEEYGNLIHSSSVMRDRSPTVKRQYASLIKFFNTQAFSFIPELEQLDQANVMLAQSILSFEFHYYHHQICNRSLEDVAALTLASLNLVLATRKK